MKTKQFLAASAAPPMPIICLRACARWIPLLLLLLLMQPAVVQAQFSYVTNHGAITITGYTGPGGAVVIPATTNSLPVTSIGRASFYDLTSLTNVTIPDSVANIEAYAFGYCYKLTGAILGKSLTNLGDYAFSDCWRLTNVCFQGNAPKCGASVFFDDPTTVCYLPEATGWGAKFADCPAALRSASAPITNAIAGGQTNHQAVAQSKRLAAAKPQPHR